MLMKTSLRVLLAVGVIAQSGCGAGGEGEVIVLNPGDGLPVESYQGMDVADMNDDGYPDIIAASARDDGNRNFEYRVNVFLQDATVPGSFAAPTRLTYGPTEGSAWNLVAVDIRLSGRPDVVLQNISEGGFLVFEQDPADPGTLMAPVHYGPTGPASGSFDESITVGDIDGDLFPDILLTSGDELALFLQNSTDPGSFKAGIDIGEGTEAVSVGDVNGDGLTDVLSFSATLNGRNPEVPDTLLYYRQNPLVPGQFLAPIDRYFDFAGDSIGVADLNRDGLNDLVVSGAVGRSNEIVSVFNVFRQTSPDNLVLVEGHVSPGETLVNDQAIADLDGDGDLELLIGRRTEALAANQIEILTQDARGSYVSSALLTLPDDEAIGNPELFSLKVADLNDDQQPDIAVSTSEIFVFFQQTGQPGVYSDATRIAGQR
jgi:hypothetical protein